MFFQIICELALVILRIVYLVILIKAVTRKQSADLRVQWAYVIHCILGGFVLFVYALVALIVIYTSPFLPEVAEIVEANVLVFGLIGLTKLIEGVLDWPEDRS